jgi:hypothetical protein
MAGERIIDLGSKRCLGMDRVRSPKRVSTTLIGTTPLRRVEVSDDRFRYAVEGCSRNARAQREAKG